MPAWISASSAAIPKDSNIWKISAAVFPVTSRKHSLVARSVALSLVTRSVTLSNGARSVALSNFAISVVLSLVARSVVLSLVAISVVLSLVARSVVLSLVARSDNTYAGFRALKWVFKRLSNFKH